MTSERPSQGYRATVPDVPNIDSLAPENVVDSKSLRKSVAAGSIGVFVHWFDWAVYAYLAADIAEIFFPSNDKTAELLSAFAVLAISFGVRPLGAFIFGALGDRFGRKKTLSIVILLMSASTLLVGILPSHAAIGVWAPLLLVLARVIQGLAAGGEFGSAAAFLAEYSPTKRRGFGVSWLEVGSLLGFLGASLAVFILTSAMSPESLSAWGWRIPFLLAAPLGVIGFYIRSKIEDTPEFRELAELEAVPQSPIKELFRHNWKELLQTSGIEIMQHVTFYIVLVYLLTYQEVELDMPASNTALYSTCASLAALVLVPIFGALSDRFGRKPLMSAASILLVVGSYPLFLVMRSGTPWAGLVGTIGLSVILSIILGVHAVTVAELFPTATRQSGLSIAYNVTAAIFAGTVPFLMTLLIAKTGFQMIPAVYLIAVGVLGFVTVLTIRESKGSNLLSKDLALLAKND